MEEAGPLWQRLCELPRTGDEQQRVRAAAFLKDIRDDWQRADLPDEALAALGNARLTEFLSAVLVGSRHLNMALQRDPARAWRVLSADPDLHLKTLIDEVGEAAYEGAPLKAWMTRLRAFKAEAALVIALADLAGIWPIMRATEALAECADAACDAAVAYLFDEACRKGEWLAEAGPAAMPHRDSGYFALAMGKHGAFELNYSSDIDLIVFYDPMKARLREGLEAPTFFIKLTRDLVKLLNERTADGYVFRTDLRLRPDPGATHVAMSIDAALHYYESFGQNWERAAMIKARPAAGDLDAGRRFLKELSPFVWRKYLDFAAIADIHAMKRQIHAHRGFAKIAAAGHNIKLGRGGIREIEFFAQTQQLIAGGRQPELRVPQTLAALGILAERNWIAPHVRSDLDDAYRFLRRIEHRIQMMGDEQTHQVPSDAEQFAALAHFSGFDTPAEFEEALLHQLGRVQTYYAELFEDGPELSSATANLVLVGEDDDPDTLASLTQMGFSQPAQVLSTVRTWHRGRYPAVRSEGARGRLTEVQPALIEALAETVNPDAALAGFDRFLSTLPAGVQLFALLKAHPELLRLVAVIMGSAPRMAQILSRRRRVFDAVLDPRIMGSLPDLAEVRRLIHDELADAHDLETVLDRARILGREQMFLIGVRLLTGHITTDEAGPAYAMIAEELIRHLFEAVDADFRQQHGAVPGGAACIVAMGRLGGREMSATSDLDLIVVYDFDAEAKMSDGSRPLAVGQYYARLTQRLISAISAQTAEGRLYEVDMRLRPSGNKGPVATQWSSFERYQANEAWTWEHMALTRARVICGPEELAGRIEGAIQRTLSAPRDREKLVKDVHEMRERIWQEKQTDNIWDLKQVRGGFVDLEFITQFLELAHASERPEILDTSMLAALGRLRDTGVLDADIAASLIEAGRQYDAQMQLLRLCFEGGFEPADAPDGLKLLLANAAGEPDFTRLELKLRETQAMVWRYFDEIVR